MQWSPSAEKAISRVPFFVRKRVRRKVEEEAGRQGASEVALEHVEACQRRFLNHMEEEVKGYQVETCFGPGGCPNRINGEAETVRKVEELLASKDVKGFLKKVVPGALKLHHEFRVTISECPNACSRPQIVDVGLIGASHPVLAEEDRCSLCGACGETCKEDAIHFPPGAAAPVLTSEACLSCGQCVAVCPTEAIRTDRRGYRILIGGKLGRHPRLGRELEGIYPLGDALRVVEQCVEHHLKHCESGERFGEVLDRHGQGDIGTR